MLAVDGGAAQFQNPYSERLIGRKAELLLGVVAQVGRCRGSRLHSIGADNALSRIALQLVLHQQVLADQIELVGVQPRLIRALKPFAQLDIEDLEAEPAGGIAIFGGLGKPHPVTAYLSMYTRLGGNLRERWRTCRKRDFHQMAGANSQLQRNPLPLVRNHWSSIRPQL